MKQTILYILLLILSLSGTAQTKDLNFFLEQAEKNSPLINQMTNEKKIIQLNLQTVKAILTKPEVNFETDILFSPIISHDNQTNKLEPISEGVNNYFGYDLAYSDGGQYQTYITAKQALFTKNIYKTYEKQAEVLKSNFNNKIILTKHKIEQLVKHQYLLCLKSKKQAEIASYLLKQMQNNLKLTEVLAKNAVYKQSDLMLLQVETQNYELQYKKYISEYKNNISDLNLLCGIKKDISDIRDIELKINPDTIHNSVFLKQYQTDSVQIIAEQEIFNLKYKPQFNLYADAGMKSIYLPSYKRFGISAGINLSWNIYDGKQRKIENSKTLIKLKTVDFNKENFLTNREIYKRKFKEQINALDEQISVIENQFNQYEKISNLYEKELSVGEVSIMNLKNLMKDIFEKKQEQILLKMQKQLLINSFNYYIF